ncbi:MAG: hypothetical protein PHI97_18975 [Desulfobulbus sp.]|nr:hypothetical protein [Desulfobulbus sp.]
MKTINKEDLGYAKITVEVSPVQPATFPLVEVTNKQGYANLQTNRSESWLIVS